MWVANRQEETISVIDTGSLQVVATVDSRPFAGRVEIGPGGRVIVLNGGGGGYVPQYLRLFDVASRVMQSEVPLRDGTPQDGNFGVLIHDGCSLRKRSRAGHYPHVRPGISGRIRARDSGEFSRETGWHGVVAVACRGDETTVRTNVPTR